MIAGVALMLSCSDGSATVDAGAIDAGDDAAIDASPRPWCEGAADADADGLPDRSEFAGDVDGDGLENRDDPDSDGDGTRDGDEVLLSSEGCPFATDSDSDGVPDVYDLDNDDDGLSDVDEAIAGSSPTSADTDGDGCTDLAERDFEGCSRATDLFFFVRGFEVRTRAAIHALPPSGAGWASLRLEYSVDDGVGDRPHGCVPGFSNATSGAITPDTATDVRAGSTLSIDGTCDPGIQAHSPATIVGTVRIVDGADGATVSEGRVIVILSPSNDPILI